MILKRKLLSLSTIGAAALLVAGPTLAAPPGSFVYGAYTVSTGTVTGGASGSAGCPNATCVDLVSGTGLLQRQVTLDGSGDQYIQTIVVDDAADTGGSFAISGGTFNLDFTNESFVGTNPATSGDLATQATVDLLADTGAGQGPTPSGNMADPNQNRVIATVDGGGLSTAPGGAAHSTVLQQQALDNAGGSTKLWLESMGESSGGTVEANRYLRMDQVVGAEGGGHPGEQGITVRKSSGLFTVQAGSDTLDLPSGSSQSYATGDDIGVVWLQLNNMGGAGLPGGSADVAFQMQNFTVNGTTNTWNSCASGVMGACNNALASGTDWSAYWDAGGNLGTAPTALDASSSNATPTTWFPNFHD